MSCAPQTLTFLCKCRGAQGETIELTQTHAIPPGLRQDQNPSNSDIKKFLATLATANDRELLQARAWRCSRCGNPATRISHMPMSYMNKPEPLVVDMASPVCSSSTCSMTVEREMANMLQGVSRSVEGGEAPKSQACLHCGKPGAAKACPRCKQAVYCTRDCLKAHYREHKGVCASMC